MGNIFNIDSRPVSIDIKPKDYNNELIVVNNRYNGVTVKIFYLNYEQKLVLVGQYYIPSKSKLYIDIGNDQLSRYRIRYDRLTRSIYGRKYQIW